MHEVLQSRTRGALPLLVAGGDLLSRYSLPTWLAAAADLEPLLVLMVDRGLPTLRGIVTCPVLCPASGGLPSGFLQSNTAFAGHHSDLLSLAADPQPA